MAIATSRTAAQTASNTFGAFLPNYWDAVLGENLYPNLTFYAFGTKRQIPRNFGLTIKIPRFKKKSGVVGVWNTASEGNAVLGTVGTSRATSEFVSGTLKQFIGVYRHSDLVVMTALSDVVNLSLKDIARDLALQMDTHIRDQISGTGTAIKLAAASVATANIIKASSFLKAAALLDGNNNPRPAGGAYPAVIHPFQQADLQGQLTGNAWIEINKFKGDMEPEMLYRGELGRLFGCAITTSTNVNRVLGASSLKFNLSAGASGYQDYVFAPESYYVTEISDMTAKTYVKQLGSAGTFDPVNTVATVGAKVFFTAIPATWLNSSGSANSEVRMVRIQAGGVTPS